MAKKLGILKLCKCDGASDEQQRAQHDVIGACFLRMRGFSEKVAHLVEGHVLAKRYLCFHDKDYYAKLSPASKTTLEFQGGFMSSEEAQLFERGELFELCKLMRTWDESAKDPDAAVPPIEAYKSRVLDAINRLSSPAEATLSCASFVRDGNVIVDVKCC